MEKFHEVLPVLFTVVGCVGSLGCFCVVLTGIRFPSLMLNDKRIFSHILFFISLCDMITDIAYSIGYPQPGSRQCGIQGFILSFFPLASWLWTTILIFQLRCALLLRRVWLTPMPLHVFTWGLSLILSLIPLSVTKGYGTDNSGRSTCFYLVNKQTEEDMQLSLLLPVLGGILPLGLCFGCMLHFTIEIIRKFDHNDMWRKIQALRILRVMGIYPLILFIFTFPRWCYQIVLTCSYVAGKNLLLFNVFNSLDLWSALNGPALAVLFFLNSPEVRQRWARTLGCNWDHRLMRASSSWLNSDGNDENGGQENLDGGGGVGDDESSLWSTKQLSTLTGDATLGIEEVNTNRRSLLDRSDPVLLM